MPSFVRALLCVGVLLAVGLQLTAAEGDARGLKPVSIPVQGAQPIVYGQSQALVIGCSAYTAWPKLAGVTEDVQAVQSALEDQGFAVQRLLDPNLVQLRQGLEDFLFSQGMVANARLVVYFAGHGHTSQMADDGGQMGYLVPVDAPDPTVDPVAFRAKAIDMRSMVTLAEHMESRHVLFVFDSCFSGSVFALRTAAEPPAVVVETLAKPVRQFITSGSAGERVPDQSIFRRLFIRGIAGEADLSDDGYITGSELGAWLFSQTVSQTRGAQNPQCGKVQNLDLNQGDIVFVSKAATGPIKGTTGKVTAPAGDGLGNSRDPIPQIAP